MPEMSKELFWKTFRSLFANKQGASEIIFEDSDSGKVLVTAAPKVYDENKEIRTSEITCEEINTIEEGSEARSLYLDMVNGSTETKFFLIAGNVSATTRQINSFNAQVLTASNPIDIGVLNADGDCIRAFKITYRN